MLLKKEHHQLNPEFYDRIKLNYTMFLPNNPGDFLYHLFFTHGPKQLKNLTFSCYSFPLVRTITWCSAALIGEQNDIVKVPFCHTILLFECLGFLWVSSQCVPTFRFALHKLVRVRQKRSEEHIALWSYNGAF